LLPGLPLNLWNKNALVAIGNLLGRFLKVDKVGLHSPDKRMVRVLVELDIHVGLMDSLELEWRGQVMVQRLDYQGLPFRCSSCRQMRHLRKECPNWNGATESEDSLETLSKDLYMSEVDSEELGIFSTGSRRFSWTFFRIFHW
jgi:hypothetical protein